MSSCLTAQDKLDIKGLEMRYLHHLCGAMVDLAYTKVRSCDAVDLVVSIISSPVYIFIRADEKIPFGEALRDVCRHRFLAISDDPEKFLGSCMYVCRHVCFIGDKLECMGRTHCETVATEHCAADQ